jgi:hypothetical protein
MTNALVLIGLPFALAVLAPLLGADSRDRRWSLHRVPTDDVPPERGSRGA